MRIKTRRQREANTNTPDRSAEQATAAGSRPPRRRLSLKDVLLLIAIAAAVVALIVERRRHADTRAALARYEPAGVSTSLPTGTFRVIPTGLIHLEHVKTMIYRVECDREFFATLANQSGDSTGRASEFDPRIGVHSVQIPVVIDHLPGVDKLKLATMGYAIYDVPSNFSLDQSTSWYDTGGIHPLDEVVDAFTLRGETYSLSIKVK